MQSKLSLYIFSINCLAVLMNRLEFCQINFPETLGLVMKNVQPFLANKISWNSVAKYDAHYLIIHENLKGSVFVLPGDLDFHTWYSKCDEEMWSNIISIEPLPSIILPINNMDESFIKGSDYALRHLLSYCTHNQTFIDILMPKGIYSTCGRNRRIPHSVNLKEWHGKEDKAWFRGTLNHGSRKGRFTIINETIR